MTTYNKDVGEKKIPVISGDEIVMDGKSYTIADDGVDVLGYTILDGLYIIRMSDDKVGLILVDGVTAIKVAGNALFTITATTDAKINVYVNAGAVKVENKTGAEASYQITKIGGIV